jgi:hypothetical protein
MHTIKLKKMTYKIRGVILSRLARVKWDNHPLDVIASLLDDVSISTSSDIIQWLVNPDPENYIMGVKYSTLIKENDTIVVDTDFNYNEEDYDTYEAYLIAKGNHEKGFITTKKVLISVLLQWQTILGKESLPNELLIVLDDDGNINLVPQLEQPAPELIT